MTTTYTVVVTKTLQARVVTDEMSFAEEWKAAEYFYQMQEERNVLSVDGYKTETTSWFPGTA